MRRNDSADMYWRNGRGWYGDFRNFRDVGGGQEALKPSGARYATKEKRAAASLFSERLQYLKDRRAGLIPDPKRPKRVPTLSEYIPRHCELKRGSVLPDTLDREQRRLQKEVEFFGDVRLDEIDTQRVNDYALWLEKQKGRYENKSAAQTRLHKLNALSSLMEDAVSEGLILSNPVKRAKKPKVVRQERPWLKSHEGHRFIVAAQELDNDSSYRGFRFMRPLIGTALLTGGRMSELFALQVSDIDFNSGLVHFRPNQHYGKRKSAAASRSVVLWPQLRDLLIPHIGHKGDEWLFPGSNGEPVKDLSDALDKVFAKAGVPKPKGVAWHLFRHTYTAMRLQTTDNGAPVSLWTVKEELGHRSVGQIEQTYGHLLKRPDRSEVIEYRPLGLADKAAKTA